MSDKPAPNPDSKEFYEARLAKLKLAEKIEAREKKRPTRKSSSQEVADIIGISTMAVTNWVKRGCPCDAEGEQRLFDVAEVQAWAHENHLTGIGGAKKNPALLNLEKRKLRALVEKFERENKQARGLLIDAAEEEKRDVDRIVAIRNKLSGLEASLPARLIGLDAVEIQTILHANFERFLNEFANDRSTLD
jgi:hypothetical protein